MYDELIITTSNQKHRAFFMNGFHVASDPTSNLHKHNFAEIHMVAKGDAVFSIGEKPYKLKNGNLMIVPQGIFHCCINKDEKTIHTAFQIDYDTSEISTCNIGASVILNFFEEIEMCKASHSYNKIASYISLFCSSLCLDENISTTPVTDYGFLIQEYLSIHYNEDLHLCDLANVLHLSERQTERLVIECTGKSFRNELLAIRMNTAKQLLNSSDMTLKQIAQYVGYDSYAGFWKAAKRHSIFLKK